MKVYTLSDLSDGIYYNVSVLKSILKGLNLNHSTYTIRNYESWLCKDYKCGKRHDYRIDACEACGGPVREPLIISPRTRSGHRRYTANEIRQIIEIFKQRK